ncbi:MAG TPA: hypothetical protein VIJ14_00680 [Rhabdochlamydiaceae bacterium]
MAAKTIVKTDEDGCLSLDSFRDIVDIEKVKYYTLKAKDGALFLKFYDKKKKLVKPYVND